MATGVVDGAHWGAATGSAGLGLYEVTNYHIRPSISISSNATEINQDAMERLPADIQGILVQSLNEHVWRVTAHNEISDTNALREAYEAHRVEIRELPNDVLAAMEEPGQGYGKRTHAQQGDEAAEQISKMEAFLKENGHL